MQHCGVLDPRIGRHKDVCLYDRKRHFIIRSMTFRELHRPGKPFVLANAWDPGSAKILAELGAQAIGTTSAGLSMTLGIQDMGQINREQALRHAHELVKATPLPVSGDLENGYGHTPPDIARTIELSSEAGLAGCSIEDTKLPSSEPYPFAQAIARIEAAVDVIRALNRDFVLTARADGVMNQKYNCEEAIRRLQAFAVAGADVVYAPLPPSMDDLARICREVDAPVNALAAGRFLEYGYDDFARIGVARISLGSSLARATYTTTINSAREIFEMGRFGALREAIGSSEIEAMFKRVDKNVRAEDGVH